MQNSPFLLWLRTLRSEDMPLFRQYLNQPQNVAKKLPSALFDYLHRYQDEWREHEIISSPQLKDAVIYTHLYPNEPIKLQRLRRIMMELRALIEAYGASTARSFLRPELDLELRTLLYLLERNSPLFLERLEDLTARLSQDYEFSDDLPLALMWMEQMRNEHLIHRQSPEDTFEQALDYLDEFYLMVKLETWTSMRTREYLYKQRHEYPCMEEIGRLVTMRGKDKPMVQLWRAVFSLVSSDESPAQYQAVIDALEVVKPRLRKNVLRQVRGYLFNALMRTRQTDSRAFFQRLHDLLETMLIEGTLHLPDGRMSHPFFLSYVRAACLSGNALKAEDFILGHNHNLASADIAGLIGYCNALVAYSLRNHRQSWKTLVALKSTDLRTEAHLRILQVQVAYSLGQEDDFFRLNETLRKFLERHQELGERFQALGKRFTQFAESLARVRFDHNKRSSTLRSRIQKEDTAEKLWLLEQEACLKG